MISSSQIDTITGAHVIGSNGDKIGTVGQVYLDDTTGEPTWVTVNTGLFGMRESFVPLDQANYDGGDLRVPYDKAMVKDAPNVDADGSMSVEEEQELFRYYGRDYGTHGTGTGGRLNDDVNERGTVGRDVSGPETDTAMTRSEEQLHVGTEKVQTGRARLRKHVVTEHETVTVPVQREEVRLEREPITEGNAGDALDGPAISEEEHEVILTEERPVVAKESVPVERVRLDKEVVTDQETVSEDVRHEEIDLDADGKRRDRF